MGKDITVSYSKRLRSLRKKYGYTQQHLAELSSIEYKHIQRLEGKNTCDVKLSTIQKISKAFKMSPSEFLDF